MNNKRLLAVCSQILKPLLLMVFVSFASSSFALPLGKIPVKTDIATSDDLSSATNTLKKELVLSTKSYTDMATNAEDSVIKDYLTTEIAKASNAATPAAIWSTPSNLLDASGTLLSLARTNLPAYALAPGSPAAPGFPAAATDILSSASETLSPDGTATAAYAFGPWTLYAYASPGYTNANAYFSDPDGSSIQLYEDPSAGFSGLLPLRLQGCASGPSGTVSFALALSSAAVTRTNETDRLLRASGGYATAAALAAAVAPLAATNRAGPLSLTLPAAAALTIDALDLSLPSAIPLATADGTNYSARIPDTPASGAAPTRVTPGTRATTTSCR